jgi:uncharacterized protein YjbI with pentapeptide repeats
MIAAQHLERAAVLVEAAGGLFGRLQHTLARYPDPRTGRNLLHVVWTQLRREQPGQYPDRDFNGTDPDAFVKQYEKQLSVQPDWAKWVPWLGRKLDRAVGRDDVETPGFLIAQFPKLIKWMRKNRPDVNKLDLQGVMKTLQGVQDDPPPQGEAVYTMPDGWTVQKLTTEEQLDAEGEYLQHCVGSYFQKVNDGATSIYSLRDPDGFPHITIEYEKTKTGHRVSQIQAKGNQFPDKHVDRLKDVVRNVLGGDVVGMLLLGEENTKLAGADLHGMSLLVFDFSGADLSGANLSESDMRDVDFSSADLTGADLHEATLIGAYMRDCDLTGANLSLARLDRASLHRANLTKANLSYSNLSKADLSNADLSDADLSGADLTRTDLYNATLSGTNPAEAIWDDTTMWPDDFEPPDDSEESDDSDDSEESE